VHKDMRLPQLPGLESLRDIGREVLLQVWVLYGNGDCYIFLEIIKGSGTEDVEKPL
ncbi:hypothetical protein BGZ95_007773, partial [Linnemannia exigua]